MFVAILIPATFLGYISGLIALLTGSSALTVLAIVATSGTGAALILAATVIRSGFTDRSVGKWS